MVARRERKSSGSGKRARSIRRKLIIRRRNEKRIPYSKKALSYRFLDCENISSVSPDRKKNWLPLHRRKGKTADIDCKDFSFIDNPIETMRLFWKIVDAECKSRGFRINFEDRQVLDIGPFLLLGSLRERMTPVILGGSIRPSTQKVLAAVDLMDFLRIGGLPKLSSDDIWPLPLHRRRRGGSSSPNASVAMQSSTVERVADQTVASVNEWLGTLSPSEELTVAGASALKTVITEALNNAERHGRVQGDGEWVTAGFMARRQSEVDGKVRTTHVCHLGLMNLGLTISDTIKSGPEHILGQLKKYQDLHRSSRISQDTLSTVFALQDGISRVEQGCGSPSGGTGMMDIVEFANEVGRQPAGILQTTVAILSGKSYIRFAHPFSRGVESGDGRRLQWFNEPNLVTAPPSNDFVMDLPHAFPGTMITARFVLDDAWEEEDARDDD